LYAVVQLAEPTTVPSAHYSARVVLPVSGIDANRERRCRNQVLFQSGFVTLGGSVFEVADGRFNVGLVESTCSANSGVRIGGFSILSSSGFDVSVSSGRVTSIASLVSSIAQQFVEELKA